MKSPKKELKSAGINIRKSTKQQKTKIPKGAQIVDKDISISTKQIENGFLVTKRTEVKYKMPGQTYSDWATIEEEYYSKNNPLTIKLNDETLADAFKDEE